MHLFLQICGVTGFGLFGAALPVLLQCRSGRALSDVDERLVSPVTTIAFALISTYFIFG